MKPFFRIFQFVATISTLWSAVAFAQTEPLPEDEPYWMDHPGMSPEAIANLEPVGPDAPPPTTFTTRSVTAATTSSNPEANEPEIIALADALGNDPLRIYNHVRNHIEFTPYQGCCKGALLTLLEGSGGSADQSTLLIALLNAAGYENTQYRYAQVGVYFVDPPGQDVVDLEEWVGLPAEPFEGQTYQDVSGTALPSWAPTDLFGKQVLVAGIYFGKMGLGGILPWNDGLRLAINHTWVKVTINGTAYELDPSLKRHVWTDGAGLASLSGYNRGNLLSAVGATSSDAYSYKGLNDAALRTQLGMLTGNVLTSLAEDHAGASASGILGGKKIVTESISALADAPHFSGESLVPWSNGTYSSLPTSHFSTLKLTIGSTVLYQANTADLHGRRLAMTFNGNNVLVWLDDTQVGSTTVSAATFNMGMTVAHPTVGARTKTATYIKNNSYMYALIYAFEASPRLLQQRQEKLKAYLDAGMANDSREVRTESLNIMGLNWFLQTQYVTDAIANSTHTAVEFRHRFGRVGQEGGFYIDVANQLSGTCSLSPNLASIAGFDAANEIVFQLNTLIMSAMEHAMIEQTQPGSSAVSTVNILRAANTAGQIIYAPGTSNWTSGVNVRGQLSNYSGTTLADLDKYLKSTGASYHVANRAILPKNGAVAQGNWTGTGYVLRVNSEAGMVINGGYSGGYSTSYGYVAPAPIISSYYTSPVSSYYTSSIPTSYRTVPPTVYSAPPVFSGDPIDMGSGAFTYGMEDMATGQEAAPRGLAFSRSYNSARVSDSSNHLGKNSCSQPQRPCQSD